MRRTTVIATALLALSLAPALQAQHRSYRDPYRDSYRNRYPETGQIERVAALAHEIDDTATYIHRQAERNNRRPNRAEARMLADLHELDDRASHFHAQVEGYRQDPRHTVDDFAALADAFYQLGDTLRYVQPRPYIDRGMDRIYDLMTELSRYYGRSGYGQWGSRDRYGNRYGDGYGHDRYDGRYGRDRYDDQDRYDDDDHGYRPPLKD